jgi:hypothetical protein
MNRATQVPDVLQQATYALRRTNPDLHEIPFYAETWRRRFSPDADLEAVFRKYPRSISRKQVAELACEAQTLDSPALRRLMFGVMLWGFGTIGYGAYRTSKMLEAPTVIDQLADTLCYLTRGRIQDAYERLHLPRCGAAFLTKLFYFIGRGCDVTPLPLILDSVVANALESKLGCEISDYARVDRDGEGKIIYLHRWAPGYVRYIEQMNAWAQVLSCRADSIELFLFQPPDE